VKTAESIEKQEERKAARDNGDSRQTSPQFTPPVKPKLKQRDATRIAKWRWHLGKSANPGGVPKHGDVARDLARAIFENNPELVYKAFVKALAKGSAYAFQVLADRGYGKLKETIQAELSPYHEYTDEELQKRLRELEEKLGYVKVLPPSDAPKPN